MTALELDEINNEYLLRLESYGYLSNTDIQSLISDLQNAGITNISTTGTTRTAQDYGARVYLKYTGKYKTDTLNFNNFKPRKEVKQIDIAVSKQTISKN